MHLESQGNKIYINHKNIDMFIGFWLQNHFIVNLIIVKVKLTESWEVEKG